MSQLRSLLVFSLKAIIAGLALAFVLVYLWPSLAGRTAHVDQPAAQTTAPAPVSYAAAVNRTAPAVVSIYTRSIETQPVSDDAEARFGLRYLYRMRQDLASGVLLSDDGYILTNHHVIALVRNIRIALWDGRIVPARIVGSDPATDLAVLKINLTGLPTAPVAESPVVRVGDVVLAIGNALGLSHTVTMGIISATGRDELQSPLYEDFIQTDAAINAGNSGGALINTNGELIGINTRNLDSAQNIGFAIPIDTAQNVMNQIIEYGSVRRGWLGVSLRDTNPITQADGSRIKRGVNVQEVVRDGPAWTAGIRPGDVIISLDGEAVVNTNRFLFTISQREPGSQVELTVERGQETFETYATLLQQPPL